MTTEIIEHLKKRYNNDPRFYSLVNSYRYLMEDGVKQDELLIAMMFADYLIEWDKTKEKLLTGNTYEPRTVQDNQNNSSSNRT